MGQADSTFSPFFAAKTLNAPEMRAALGALAGPSPASAVTAEQGVIPGGGNTNSGLVPTSTGSGAAPAVSVSPGQCVIQRPVGGTYICTLPVAASGILLQTPLPAAGQTRIDLLCVTVVDGEADGGTPPQTNVMRLITVTGTAAASPTAPATPAGNLALYQITVNNAGALTFADVRTYTRGVGGVRFVAAGDVRAGSAPADLRVFATGQVDAWLNLTGTWAWVTIVAPSVWTQINSPWTYSGGTGGTVNFGTGGSAILRYKRAGNDLTVSYQAKYGTSPNGGTGNLSTLLPNGWATPAGRDQWIAAHLYVNDPISGYAGDYAGMALVGGSGGGSGGVLPFFPLNINTTQIGAHKIADTAGVPGHSIPLIGGGYAQGGLIHVFGTIEIAS